MCASSHFTLNRSFHPTSSVYPESEPILLAIEIQMMWSQSVKPRQTIKNREKRERKEKKKKRKRKQKRQVGVLNNVIQEDRKGKAEKRTTYVPKRDIIPVARTCL